MALSRSLFVLRRLSSGKPALQRQAIAIRSFAASSDADINVPVRFEAGKFHAKFPLLAKAGLTDISLNRNSTVQDLTEKLAAADPSIQHLDVHTVDGVKIAKASQIGSLMTKDVIVEYGPVRLLLQSSSKSSTTIEMSQLSAVIDNVATHNEGGIRENELEQIIRDAGISDVEPVKNGLLSSGLMSRLEDIATSPSNSVYVYSGCKSSAVDVLVDTESELRAKLEYWQQRTLDLEAQDKEMTSMEQSILKRAQNRAAVKKLGVLSFLAAQFGTLFYFVYDVYSWDIMEPFGYFLGAGYTLAAALYFSLTKKDPTYGHLLTTSQAKTIRKLNKQIGYDPEAHKALRLIILEHQTALEVLRTRLENCK